MDAIPATCFRPRIILACSRTARFISMDPARSDIVGEEGRWPPQRRSRGSISGISKPKTSEPNWITGVCVNPEDGDLYALQYKVQLMTAKDTDAL